MGEVGRCTAIRCIYLSVSALLVFEYIVGIFQHATVWSSALKSSVSATLRRFATSDPQKGFSLVFSGSDYSHSFAEYLVFIFPISQILASLKANVSFIFCEISFNDLIILSLKIYIFVRL